MYQVGKSKIKNKWETIYELTVILRNTLRTSSGESYFLHDLFQNECSVEIDNELSDMLHEEWEWHCEDE